MRNLTLAVLLMIAALTGGAATFYWLRAHGGSTPSALVPISVSTPASFSPNGSADPLQPSERSHGAGSNPLPYSSGAKSPVPEVDATLPLRTGEILDFTATVAKLSNVANLRLQVAERRNFLGKTAWHLQAFAHTENPLRMVFELDDQFDSYSDAASMASLQYEMHLNERGEKLESVQRMTATGREPASPNATQARVLPGTRDPLGMMQYLRNVDWTKSPQVHSPVYDGHKLYDVRARLAAGNEAVTVPAGNYRASKIELRVFDNGTEMKDAHFVLYFANNSSRTPVLLEATLPFAVARVELLRAK